VLVDAAAELPPQANLRRFIAAGADLVAFSGGKAIGGPQASGILCGRRDLIMSAALQHLDLDIFWEQWSPPGALIDKARLRGIPQHGIGRPCKVGKEEIVGLLTALDMFMVEGDAARHRRWLALMKELAHGLDQLPGAAVTTSHFDDIEKVPSVGLALAPDAGFLALDLVIALQNGDPAVHVDPGSVDRAVIGFNPMCLQTADVPRLIGRVRAAVAALARP
jgi:L-seryl-tRNA(Ser) seleniumtransferase